MVRSNKRQNLSSAFFFCVKADGLSAKLTPERDLSMTILGWLRILRMKTNKLLRINMKPLTLGAGHFEF